MAGPQLRHILSRMTTNRLTGLLTGTFVTCAVQSSSATTVMTVSFVSAGLLTLSQAISIIMGANIGTTLTAWIMSLGYSVDLTNVVFPAFFVGMILIYKKRHRYLGDLLFGTAFLFLSLVMLSAAGKDLDLEHN
jgi:phosphate:Na+ symporter